MGAPTFDLTKPNAANAWNTDLDAIRENWEWLMLAAAATGYMLPGWTTTVTGTSEPTVITMTKGSLGMRWNFTWSGGSVTQVVWQYNDGSGYATLAGGTLSVSYDGSGNFSGVTSA